LGAGEFLEAKNKLLGAAAYFTMHIVSDNC